MKKVLMMILLVLCTITLFTFGCNKQIVDLNYRFKKVHIVSENKCYELKSWRDYDDSDQIQVNIKDYGVCLFHSNQVVLIEDKCPYCD